jgi:hypothetical protein
MYTTQRIIIPECDWRKENPKQVENFALLSQLKKEKRFDESSMLIDAIEVEGSDYFRQFLFYANVNKERAYLYRKLKNKQLAKYHVLLQVMGLMLHGAYFAQNTGLVEDYSGNNFSFDNEMVEQRIRAYANWFKPLAFSLVSIHKDLEREMDDAWKKYSFTDSNSLKVYMYKKHIRFNEILNLMESNMPHTFFDKSLYE